MFKGFAVIALGVFLGLALASASMDAGPGFFILSILTLGAGGGFVYLAAIPRDFFRAVWLPVREPLPGTPASLAAEIDSVAGVIRQDGLLALESKRRELRSPELKFFLKITDCP